MPAVQLSFLRTIVLFSCLQLKIQRGNCPQSIFILEEFFFFFTKFPRIGPFFSLDFLKKKREQLYFFFNTLVQLSITLFSFFSHLISSCPTVQLSNCPLLLFLCVVLLFLLFFLLFTSITNLLLPLPTFFLIVHYL